MGDEETSESDRVHGCARKTEVYPRLVIIKFSRIFENLFKAERPTKIKDGRPGNIPETTPSEIWSPQFGESQSW